MKQFVNLTEHEITIFASDISALTVPPSGIVSRIKEAKKTEYIDIGLVEKVPLIRRDTISVTNLPIPEQNKFYLVSNKVLAYVKNRNDILAPDTSHEGSVRDKKNNVIGTRKLIGNL